MTVQDRVGRRGPLAAVVGALLVASMAIGQHADNYETGYVSSTDGVIITGQQGYYIPVTDSNDGLVVQYVGNAFGIPPHPTGGGVNFVASIGGDPAEKDGVPFARSQKDVPFNGLGFVIAYDVCVTKLGDSLTSNNIGSLSSQTVPGGSTFAHIDLFTWIDAADATLGWAANEVWFTEDGGQENERIAEFDDLGLEINHWYRRTSKIGLDSNRVLEISITDLETGETITVLPEGRYLAGGAGGNNQPTGFRYFAGCNGGDCTQGNTLAWDNMSIVVLPPTGSCCISDTGECLTSERDPCEAMGGVFNGVGTSCETTECFQRTKDGWVLDAPFTWAGDTCDTTDDCILEEDGNDEQWVVTIPYAETWTFSFCDNTALDTFLYIGDDASGGACTFFASNDDDCGTASLLALDLEPGTVFVTVEPSSPGDCDDFTLRVTAPCQVGDLPTRPEGADDEPEACGDDTNGGCNDPAEPFTPIACGQTYWSAAYFDGATRDTDWYEIVLTEETEIRLSGASQFDGSFGVIDTGGSGDCKDANVISPAVSTSPCLVDGGITEYGVTAILPPGTWWFFGGAQFNDVVVCGTRSNYIFTLRCGACIADLDGSGMIDFGDILEILSTWGDIGGPNDIDDSGVVDFGDILRILGSWGEICP